MILDVQRPEVCVLRTQTEEDNLKSWRAQMVRIWRNAAADTNIKLTSPNWPRLHSDFLYARQTRPSWGEWSVPSEMSLHSPSTVLNGLLLYLVIKVRTLYTKNIYITASHKRSPAGSRLVFDFSFKFYNDLCSWHKKREVIKSKFTYFHQFEWSSSFT